MATLFPLARQSPFDAKRTQPGLLEVAVIIKPLPMQPAAEYCLPQIVIGWEG